MVFVAGKGTLPLDLQSIVNQVRVKAYHKFALGQKLEHEDDATHLKRFYGLYYDDREDCFCIRRGISI